MRIPALVLVTLALSSLATAAVAQDGVAIRRANMKAKADRAEALRAAKAQSLERFIDWQRRRLVSQKSQATRKGTAHPKAARSALSQKDVDALRKRPKALEHAKAAGAAGARRAPVQRAPTHRAPARRPVPTSPRR
jgi:hypothetical protein